MSDVATVTGQGTFTDTDFDAVAALYAQDESGAKFARLMDAIAAIGVDDREDHLSRIEALVVGLERMSEYGQGYTPPSGKGFGSDNAAVIADKILGKAQTVGATRKAFRDWGKNVNVR